MPRADQIEKAAALLNAGELVAFPTETVYGLGGDAGNSAAVARIFAAKGRPASHPLIVHVSNLAAARRWASAFPDSALRLAEAFWPGPLTLVVPKADHVLAEVTGGQSTIALRAPAHPVARALLAAVGRGIAAPSANRYGRISPTRADDVREELGDRVAMVLDGGDCEVGLESTIVACLDGQVMVLRPGAVSRRQIADVVGVLTDADVGAPRAPGSGRSHYAPHTPLAIVDGADLNARIEDALRRGERLAVLTHAVAPIAPERITWRPLPAELAAYGHDLYATLRDLDRADAARILVESVPVTEAWEVVADRLRRAAGTWISEPARSR
jgi:L-threonylcarbamoyladenylate synthase